MLLQKEGIMSYVESSWGGFEALSEESGQHVVKRLYIFPGCCMSNQRHSGRLEQWNVVKGTLGLSVDGEDYELSRGESMTVEQGSWHAAYNNGDDVVEVIEVWVGEDLREDDIERKPYTGTLLDLGWKYGHNLQNTRLGEKQ